MQETIKIHWEWKKFSDFTDPHILYQVLALRSQVFVLEQGCAYLDLDGKDQAALHLLGYVAGQNKVIAYARIFLPVSLEDPKAMFSIGRVVVDANYRGKGAATSLMKEGIRYISNISRNTHRISISAQHHLISFYKKLGFLPIGDPYNEDGILHICMEM